MKGLLSKIVILFAMNVGELIRQSIVLSANKNFLLVRKKLVISMVPTMRLVLAALDAIILLVLSSLSTKRTSVIANPVLTNLLPR